MEAHPRSRGENLNAVAGGNADTGSSPLTRGKPILTAGLTRCIGLIPAHAGKTFDAARHVVHRAAHPRSRGENSRPAKFSVDLNGSSPLTRGKPLGPGHRLGNKRLIPAHAGKTLPDLRFYCADRSDLGNP